VATGSSRTGKKRTSSAPTPISSSPGSAASAAGPEITTHRHLAFLSAAGCLDRVHGGAVRSAPSLPAAWLGQACHALDRDDLAAVEPALREALAALYRCSLVRQSSGTNPDGPGTPCSAG